jgi:hypothetical protein
MPPLDRPPRSKADRKLAMAERALQELSAWMKTRELTIA